MNRVDYALNHETGIIQQATNNSISQSLVLQQTFKLVRVLDLIEKPQQLHWVIKGIFEKGSMNLIAGAYGSGKSLIAFEIAFCVAAGIDWHGHKVTSSGVVIIAGEGHSGISQRFAALSIHYKIDCPDNIYVSDAPANLTEPDATNFVLDAVESTGVNTSLVIIDTLNRNFGNGDENSTKDMTLFVNNVDKHFRKTDKTVIVIHHTAKANQNQSRGSVVLPAACESEFIVKKGGETGLSLTCEKQKNGKKINDMSFSIKEIELPNFSFDDEKVTSVVIELGRVRTDAKNKYKALTQDETHVMNALAKVYENMPKPIPNEITQNYSIDKKHSVILISDWRVEAYKRLSVESESGNEKDINNAKKSKFSRVRKVLFKKNRVIEHGEYAWYYDHTVPVAKNKTKPLVLHGL